MDLDDPPARVPLRGRLPAGGWAALAWFAGVLLTYLPRAQWLHGPRPDAAVTEADVLLWLCLASVIALAGCAVLRRWPYLALALLLVASVVVAVPLGMTEVPLPQFLAVYVALAYLGAVRSRAPSLTALGSALAVLACFQAFVWLDHREADLSAQLSVGLVSVITWLIGHATRQAREQAERATAQIIADERVRVARELHDTVAHSMGVIALQAGAARQVIDTQPARARDALGDIETLGRQTLATLRTTLGALRGDGPAPLESAPGLAALDALAATTAQAGVRVRVRWAGERRPLPPQIDASAYRIIQEAVTNVVRHARTDACEVVIRFDDDQLSIDVLDDGRGGGNGSGYGLVGMRERVALLNGRFSAGPRPGGGFRVHARLPVGLP